MLNAVDVETALLAPAAARALCGGLSESTVRRLVSEGRFPSPIILARNRRGGAARIAWSKADLVAWCVEQIKANRATSERAAAATQAADNSTRREAA